MARRVEHAVLGGQPVGEQVHPPTHRLSRLERLEQLAGAVGQPLDLVLVDGVDEGLAGGEVAVEGADADAGLARDGPHRGLAAGGEGACRRREQHLAVVGRVGSERWCGGHPGESSPSSGTCSA